MRGHTICTGGFNAKPKTHALMPRDRLAKKLPRCTLFHAESVLRVPVQGDGGVESDTWDVWSGSQAAKNLHGDTAKFPCGTFFESPSQGINACARMNTTANF